jgi:hypothetical protein
MMKLAAIWPGRAASAPRKDGLNPIRWAPGTRFWCGVSSQLIRIGVARRDRRCRAECAGIGLTDLREIVVRAAGGAVHRALHGPAAARSSTNFTGFGVNR